VFDVPQRKQIARVDGSDELVLLADGSDFLIGEPDGSGKPVMTFRGAGSPFTISPDRKHLAAATSADTIAVFTVRTTEREFTASGLDYGPQLAFSCRFVLIFQGPLKPHLMWAQPQLRLPRMLARLTYLLKHLLFNRRQCWCLLLTGRCSTTGKLPSAGIPFRVPPHTSFKAITNQATDAWIESGGIWCEDGNENMVIAKGITTTEYSFYFVGAQPGRWRVWAVDQAGHAGPSSAFRTFRYTR